MNKLVYKYVNDYKNNCKDLSIDDYLEGYYFEIVIGHHLDFDKVKKRVKKILKSQLLEK